MTIKNGKRPTSHRSTTYPCYVPILGDSAGAGRVGLAGANIQSILYFTRPLHLLNIVVYCIIKKLIYEKL